MGESVVISLSGGVDSTTLLAWLLKKGYKPYCIHFQYGSKHNSYELEAARRIAEYYNVSLEVVDISNVVSKFKSDLLKTGGEIPEGHFTATQMSKTVVPARNIIFLSILAGFAWSVDAPYIALGIHASDDAIYPDCRKEFYKAMDTAIYLGTDKKVEFLAPFVSLQRWEVVKEGLKLSVPYHLTRTCYKDQPKPCGRCGACVERQEAFYKNGTVDPLDYEDKDFWKSVVGVE